MSGKGHANQPVGIGTLEQSAMPDLQQERRHLAQADRHTAEGKRRVADQIARIERMIEKGHDTMRTRNCSGTSSRPSRPGASIVCSSWMRSHEHQLA
jgi:hypothetical protein